MHQNRCSVLATCDIFLSQKVIRRTEAPNFSVRLTYVDSLLGKLTGIAFFLFKIINNELRKYLTHRAVGC